MARYELGAIYEIDAGEKSYYARLLNCDLYGVFAPLSGEISEEAFENTPYRHYSSHLSCNGNQAACTFLSNASLSLYRYVSR